MNINEFQKFIQANNITIEQAQSAVKQYVARRESQKRQAEKRKAAAAEKKAMYDKFLAWAEKNPEEAAAL